MILLSYWRIVYDTHFPRQTVMSQQTKFSLHTLPVQLVYRILDNFDNKTLFMSCYGVCQRLNDIMDTYKPYQVIFHLISSSVVRYILFFKTKSIILVSFLGYSFEETGFIWKYLIFDCILRINTFYRILGTEPAGFPVEALKPVEVCRLFNRFYDTKKCLFPSYNHLFSFSPNFEKNHFN